MTNEEVIAANKAKLAKLDEQLQEPVSLSEVASVARSLMNQHGLGHWKFQFDRSVNRFGVCRYRLKTISLSAALCQLNGITEIKDTILHEIAHALVGTKQGHNSVWRSKALSIGCDGERRYGDEVMTPPSKLVAVCDSCNRTVERNRRPRRPTACYHCCKQYNGGYFHIGYLLTFKSRYEQRMSGKG